MSGFFTDRFAVMSMSVAAYFSNPCTSRVRNGAGTNIFGRSMPVFTLCLRSRVCVCVSVCGH